MYSESTELREIRRPSLFAANGLFFLSLAGIFAVSLLERPIAAALARFFPGAGWEVMLLSVQMAYYMLFLFMPTALVLNKGGAWEGARLKPVSAGKLLAVAALSLLGAVVVLQVNALWVLLLEALHIPFYNTAIGIPETAVGTVAAVFSYGVLPGVCEELVFRGAILGAYERRGTKKAVAVAAVLFALVHGSLGGLPTQLILGAIMGFLAFACDSIYAPMVYHAAHNLALLLIGKLAERLPEQPVEGGTLLEQVGGPAAVLQSLAFVAALGTGLVFALRAFNRRRIARGIAAVPARRERMSGGARAVLIAALVLAAILYAVLTMAA